MAEVDYIPNMFIQRHVLLYNSKGSSSIALGDQLMIDLGVGGDRKCKD
jgi:hypothetical protein